MAKMYKFCLQNSIKSDPQLDFVPMNQVGRTGYFLAATALFIVVRLQVMRLILNIIFGGMIIILAY